MLYFNKKTTNIAIVHALLEVFFMQLCSFMPTLKHQKNLTVEQISTLPNRENNTTSCQLVGEVLNTVKRPKNRKKKKQRQPPVQHPNLANLNQTKEKRKNQTNEKEQTSPTSSPRPQSINLSQTNRTSNPRTNEPTNKQHHRTSEQHMCLQ
jgi:hypothetical protein